MTSVSKWFDPKLADLEEMQEIIKAVDAELDNVRAEQTRILNNFFIQTADETAISRYEKMLDIFPKASETLNDRRFRLLTLYKGDLPYTYLALKHELEDIVGVEDLEMTLGPAACTLEVYIGLSVRSQYDTVYDIIKKMLPANIALTYSLKYNQHSTLAKYTHVQLAELTHYQVRNQIMDEET